MIECRRRGTTAQFYAEALDTYGNAKCVGESQPFSINPWSVGLPPSEHARVAHEQLLEQLSSHGWASGGEPASAWYAQTLQQARS